MLYQDLGDLGWIQLAMHWNSNRNNFYNNPTFYPTVSTLQTVNGVPTGVTPFPLGPAVPPRPTCAYSPGGSFTGTGPVNNAPGFGLQLRRGRRTCTPHRRRGSWRRRTTPMCSSFYGVRINPSDTGNIRLSSLFHLTDDLSLTVDPSIQYVLANGGGYTSLSRNRPAPGRQLPALPAST